VSALLVQQTLVQPAHAQSQRPSTPIGDVLAGMRINKMEERNNAKILYWVGWGKSLCSGGKRNTWALNDTVLWGLGAEDTVKAEGFMTAALFIFDENFKDDFLKDEMKYTFSILQGIKGDLDSFLEKNPELKTKLQGIIGKYKPGYSAQWSERREDIYKLADLGCSQIEGLEALIQKMVEGIDYKKIAAEMKAVEAKYGPAPGLDAGPN
jgi:hypothetical protein